jgi:hypothetical protein
MLRRCGDGHELADHRVDRRLGEPAASVLLDDPRLLPGCVDDHRHPAGHVVEQLQRRPDDRRVTLAEEVDPDIAARQFAWKILVMEFPSYHHVPWWIGRQTFRIAEQVEFDVTPRACQCRGQFVEQSEIVPSGLRRTDPGAFQRPGPRLAARHEKVRVASVRNAVDVVDTQVRSREIHDLFTHPDCSIARARIATQARDHPRDCRCRFRELQLGRRAVQFPDHRERPEAQSLQPRQRRTHVRPFDTQVEAVDLSQEAQQFTAAIAVYELRLAGIEIPGRELRTERAEVPGKLVTMDRSAAARTVDLHAVQKSDPGSRHNGIGSGGRIRGTHAARPRSRTAPR